MPAAPEIGPETDEFKDTAVIEITCETDGATIYYTLDGTDPSELSAEYTDPLVMTASATIRAISGLGDTKSEIIESVSL